MRQEIAKLYEKQNAEDGVVVLAPEEGIYLSAMALVESGDEVIVPWPSYQSLYEVARARGAQIKKWIPRRGEQARSHYTFSTDDLAELITPRTRLVVINFPHK